MALTVPRPPLHAARTGHFKFHDHVKISNIDIKLTASAVGAVVAATRVAAAGRLGTSKYNTKHNSHNRENDDDNEEAYPPFLSCGTGRFDCSLGIFDPMSMVNTFLEAISRKHTQRLFDPQPSELSVRSCRCWRLVDRQASPSVE